MQFFFSFQMPIMQDDVEHERHCPGVIVVLGLGTALRLALEFCHEWNLRRVVQRVETNVSIGYHPAL